MTQPHPPQTMGRHRTRNSVLLGVLSGLLVLGILGAGTYLTRPTAAWTSEVSLLVRPEVPDAERSVAGYFENLSNGRVVQTYAEILRSRQLGADGTSDPTVTVHVVPGTFLIRVVVTAPDRAAAAAAGARLGEESVAAIEALDQPYVLRVVGPAGDNVESTGGLQPELLGVVALVALLAGVGVQQLVWWLSGRAPQYALTDEDDDQPPVRPGHKDGIGTAVPRTPEPAR